MRKYMLIGIGGFLGAILRYAIKNLHIVNGQLNFPINTLIINVTGSFLLALILTASLRKSKLGSDVKLGITTGFLGAFTTFSTLCKETALLVSGGYYSSGILYMLLSILLGLGAAYLGAYIVKGMEARISGKQGASAYEVETGNDTEDEVDE